MDNASRAPDCLRCEHFFVTWDPNFPRGCRVFGIKSRELPSWAVHRNTGRHCPAFKEKAVFARQEREGETR
jgi:hypothetical protein